MENVAEKLEAEGFGFIVAKLGSVKNKEAFIANQTFYPNMTTWRSMEKDSTTMRQAQEALENVSQGFDGQLRHAQLKAEYDALLKETTYKEMLRTNSTDNKWLYSKPSRLLMKLFNLYQMKIEKEQHPGFLFRLKWTLSLGYRTFSFLNKEPNIITYSLEKAYYYSRKTEIEQELQTIESTLQSINLKQNVKDLRSASLEILKSKIAKRYGYGTDGRKVFSIKDIKLRTKDFLKEYPVVLSTTYSAKSCISKDMVFDYVIMDEASQVDIKTGVLAFRAQRMP